MSPSDSIHRQTWDLIPWIVNQSASADERECARRHLETCADCRDELALQSRIHAGLNAGFVEDGDRARAPLRKLSKLIDDDHAHFSGSTTQTTIGAARSGRGHHNRRRWLAGLAAAVVVQAIGLIALGAMLRDSRSMSERSGGYGTLSASETTAASATIRLVPSPNQTVGELQQLLDEEGLHVVGSNRGARILALAPVAAFSEGVEANGRGVDDRTREAIERLRNSPDILLAEPILSASAVQ